MKKIILSTIILLLSFTNVALAHTGLESSSPQNGELVINDLAQITLTFDTNIEQGSIFTLQNADGQEIAIQNITVNGNQLIGDFSNPLANGDYTVNWSIIGADGHIIENSFNFKVDVPVEEVITEEEAGIETPNDTVLEQTQTQMQTGVNEDGEIEEEATSNVVPIAIGVVIVIIIVALLLLMKRKR